MKSITINGSKRESVGKKATKALRNAGQVPCVLYGGESPVHFSALELAFSKLVYTPNAHTVVIALGDVSYNAVLQDIQFHPVTDIILHMDFLRVSGSAKVAVAVPVEFINEDNCPGLRIGGVLNVVRYEVELLCPATAIPEKITVDLDGIKIGDSIHISAIPLPDGVQPTITDRDFTVATIASPGGGVKNEDEEVEDAEGDEATSEDESSDD